MSLRPMVCGVTQKCAAALATVRFLRTISTRISVTRLLTTRAGFAVLDAMP